MNPHDPHDPHDPIDGHDDDLRRLLTDAVDDLEPGDGLTQIRAQIRERTKVTPMTDRRPWLYALSGAVATAAVITAVAVAGSVLGGDEEDPGPAAATSEETTTTQESPSPEPTPTEEPTQPTATAVVPAYYLGDGPGGPVLYREFHEVGLPPGAEAAAAAAEAVSSDPRDPDYRSAWPDGVSVASVEVVDDVARVDLVDAPQERPAGLSQREAELAVQQVVYSVQGALQDRSPVQLTVDGQAVDQVLGVSTAEPLTNAPVLETLSLMSITTPTEGETVSGTFTAEGVSNGVEANVVWEVLDGSGAVVADGFGTAEGWMAERLFPWTVEVDLSGLAPGEYTFLARTGDPSGGAEGNGPASDDKTIVIE